MDTLPPEVLRLIIDDVADCKNCCGSLSDLKSLRLVNKEISAIAAEFVFDDVLLNFNEASYTKMIAIAHHDTYKGHIRQIRIRPKPLCNPFLNRVEFEEWLRGRRNVLNIWGMSCRNAGHCCHIPDSIQMTPEIIDFHYAHYTSIYWEQQIFFPAAEMMLQAAIGCFPNLNEIDSGMHTPSRKGPEPQSDHEVIMQQWKFYAQPGNFDMDQALMTLRAVERGASNSASQIDVMPIFMYFDTMIIDLADEEDRKLIQRAVKDFTNYNVFFNSSNLDGLQRLHNEGECASFLASMPKLERLTASTQLIEDMGMPDIATTFGDTIWSNLRSLELERFLTTADRLIALFGRHKPTLSNIFFRNIFLFDGTWSDVFHSLPGGVLQHVEVYHLSSQKIDGNDSQDGGDDSHGIHDGDAADDADDKIGHENNGNDEDEGGVEMISEGGDDEYENRDDEDDDENDNETNEDVTVEDFLDDRAASQQEDYFPYHGYLKATHPLHRYLVLGEEWAIDMAEALKEQRVDLWN